MQNYVKTLRASFPRFRNLREFDCDLLMACTLFLAYAHICQKRNVRHLTDLLSMVRLLGLDEARFEGEDLRVQCLSNELLGTLSQEFLTGDACRNPGRFVAEVFQEFGLIPSRFGNWSGFSFSLLEVMKEWTQGASKVVLRDSGTSPLVGLVSDSRVPVEWYVSFKEIVSLARVVSAYMGLDIQSHFIHFDEKNSFSSSVEAGTGMLEIFPFGSPISSYCSSQLENLVDNILGPIAAILPPLMGFSATQSSSRRKMLESGRLYAIVSFPTGIMTSPAIPVDLYLLSPKGTSPQTAVRMVSLSSELFWESRPSRRGVRNFSKAGIAAIKNVLADGPLSECETLVSVEDLLRSKDAKLSVDRYVFEPSIVSAKRLLEKFPRTLSDVADIVRPVPVQHAEVNGQEFREVGSQDITGIGTVESVSKPVFVDHSKISKGFENMVLRDGDIVFFIKGNVGTCALVSSGAPNRICSQSAVIIRLRNDVTGISYATMLRYLRSETVSSYLSTLVSGTTVRFISVKMVEKLPIPVLSEGEIQIQEQLFQKQQSLMAEIENLKLQIQTLSLVTLPENWA